ncbi:MAG: serine/threonine-protein kinase [Chloracidobacterium sp.]|nr:serine/threonine-protein kinase [Chloracidobacterium sp.]MDW8218555.1 serine/threonine-protein kinase [Acidobacteriota bacterium]
MDETIAIMSTASPPSDPLIGRVIAGRFRILSKLGEGGMGAVYKAEQLKVNRLCAVKVLSASFASDPDALARFNREAQMSSAFNHPHAVTIYDFGDDDGLHYLAMEFVEGETLSSVLRREGPLPLGRTLNIARQAAAALEAAHRMNIVHRDLKPDNIMLARRDEGDWVKILDFGIAKIASDAPQRGQDLTQAGFVVGTPLYMSPEQLAGERLDARSDIYSLAIIIYQMLTGRLPFTGDNMQALMVKRLTEDPLPLQQANPSVVIPPGVEAALLRALQRQRDRRTPTVREFISELEAGQASTRPQMAAGTTNPFTPGAASFSGERAYPTVPTKASSAAATGGATPQPTAAAVPLQPGYAPPLSTEQSIASSDASPPSGDGLPQLNPPPTPPVVTPATAPPARWGGGMGGVVAALALAATLVMVGGAVGAYFLFWSRDGGRQAQSSDPKPSKGGSTHNGDIRINDTPKPLEDNSALSDATKAAFASGVKALMRKDYVEAERQFRAVLGAAPGFGKAHLNLGIALYHQRKFTDALDHFAVAARTCEDESCKNFAYNYRGRIHWEQRKYALAEEDFRQAVVHDANDLSSVAFRGFMLQLDGRTADANQLFDEVLARSRDENLNSVVRRCKGSALPPVTASDAGIGPGQ